jgi:hypothetical protein
MREYTAIYDIKNTIQESQTKRIERKAKLTNFKMVKIAFDTRMFKPDLDVHPNKSMQNFHSSQIKLNATISNKLTQLKRVYGITEILKQEFQREKEYQDSYIRSLNHQLYRTLRIKEADAGYSDAQHALNSINYVEELLYTRYRLTLDEIEKMSDKNLRDHLIKLDVNLLHLDPIVNPKEYKVAKNDESTYSETISKLLQAPEDSEKEITIRVSNKKEKEQEQDSKLEKLIASLKNDLEPLVNKKITNDDFINLIDHKIMKKYKSALDERLSDFSNEIKNHKEELRTSLKKEERNEERNEEKTNRLEKIVSSLKDDLDPMITRKIINNDFIDFLDNKIMGKYKSAFDEKLQNFSNEIKNNKEESIKLQESLKKEIDPLVTENIKTLEASLEDKYKKALDEKFNEYISSMETKIEPKQAKLQHNLMRLEQLTIPNDIKSKYDDELENSLAELEMLTELENSK